MTTLRVTLLVVLLTSGTSSYAGHDQQTELAVRVADTYSSFMLPHLDVFRNLLNDTINDESINLSCDCRTMLHLFEQGLQKKTVEAMTMFSSFSKGHSGFFTNRISDFGHYDLCLHSQLNGSHSRYFLLQVTHPFVKVKKPRNPTDSYQGLINFGNFAPFPILHAICLPSECTIKEVEAVINHKVIQRRIHPLSLEIYSSESLQDKDLFGDYYWPRLISKIMIASLCVVTILATYFPHLLREDIAQSFDAQENTRVLLKRGSALPDDRLYVFNAYKTLYLLAGPLTHLPLVFNLRAYPFMHSGYQRGMESGFAAFFNLAGLAVTINFMASAALAVITVVPFMTRISFTQFIVGRALRTLPVIAMITLIQIALSFSNESARGRGPLFLDVFTNITGNCALNGWRDLTFMTTSIPMSQQCTFTCWFTSVDFRLYVLSFFTFVFLSRSPKIGVILLACQGLLGTLVHYWFLKSNNIFPPITIPFETAELMQATYENVQFELRGYISSYTVGMALGFALLKMKKRSCVSIPLVLLSIFGITISSISYMSVYDLRTRESVLSREQQILFAATIRSVFLSSFALLFYTLFQTSEAIITFCKGHFFTIMSRLSFTTFMIHPVFITYLQASSSQVPDFSLLDIFSKYVFVMLGSLIFGYLIMILVEYPMNNLLKKPSKERAKQQ